MDENKIKASLSLGLTISPAQFESIRVDASFHKEVPESYGKENLWKEVQTEVENQLSEQFSNILQGYKELKNPY